MSRSRDIAADCAAIPVVVSGIRAAFCEACVRVMRDAWSPADSGDKAGLNAERGYSGDAKPASNAEYT
jgi:hypothetical protein